MLFVISLFKVKHFFQKSFFPSVDIEGNKLDQNFCNSKNLEFNYFFFRILCLSLEVISSLAIVTNEFNQLYSEQVLIIFLSISSNTVFKIQLTQCVAVVKILKRWLISFFTVLNDTMNDHINTIESIDSNVLIKSHLEVTETVLYGDSYSNSI